MLDRDGVLAHAASWSMVAGLPEPDRSALLDELSRYVPPGDHAFPLRTDVSWATLPG